MLFAFPIYSKRLWRPNRRGLVVRDFYDHALQGEETKWHFPEVNADSMWNISDALGIDLTIEDVQVRVLQALTKLGCLLEETKQTLFTLQISKST